MLMKKNWKNRKGVSPVIATILMVAITVVLAAVLYVMVMGFGGEPSSVPTGEFKTPEKISDSDTERIYRVQVLSISEAKEIGDMKFSIAGDGKTNVLGVTDGAMDVPDANANVTGLTSVTFTDLNGDGKVSTGDYFTVTITPESEGNTAVTYTVGLSYSPSSGTGGVICNADFTVDNVKKVEAAPSAP